MMNPVPFPAMRFFLAGLLTITLATLALGQPRGEIESIGLGGEFRLDCWTPMVVRLVPGSAKAGTYQLQVKQFDESGDRQVFTRDITLNAEDQSSQQRFWMYFIPEPIDGGLPAAAPGGGSVLKDLQRRLRVVLASADGTKPIAELPATSNAFAVDLSGDHQVRGKKLIVCVSDGSSLPAWPEYLDRFAQDMPVVGYNENVRMVTLKPSDLPDNVLGYDAVDAIVWLNADPNELQRGGENKLQTLREYVRGGGPLVICSGGNDWQRAIGFGDLLPVSPTASVEKADLYPLRQLATRPGDRSQPRADDPWNAFKGPFRLVKAEPKVNTVVDEWIEWSKDPKDRTPYIARRGYGMGSVTWVAQDLGDPVLTARAAPGWAYIWDRVFDWKNATILRSPWMSKEDWEREYVKFPSRPDVFIDMGWGLQDITLTSKSMAYIAIAIFFFVIYWVVAGPGAYVALAAKKRSQFSWLAYCLTAIAATLITVLLVKVLLRGAPELKHLSIVKIAPNQPAIVQSRFGLYIPEDGERRIELKETAPETTTALTSLAIHPNYITTPDYKPATEYFIPVRDASTNEPAVFNVPYRSTLRKFSARWVGQFNGGIVGAPAIDPERALPGLTGRLTNSSDVDFQDIYLAYQVRQEDNKQERLLYIPQLKKGESIDLKKDTENFSWVGTVGGRTALPGQGKILADYIGQAGISLGWDNFWFDTLHMRNTDPKFSDANRNYMKSFPLLSFFNRISPVRNDRDRGRVELVRRGGGRMFDVSPALSAGQLVVLARAQGPIPIPMDVEGSPVTGTGTTFYQFILPLDRTAFDAANARKNPTTTQATTQAVQ